MKKQNKYDGRILVILEDDKGYLCQLLTRFLSVNFFLERIK